MRWGLAIAGCAAIAVPLRLSSAQQTPNQTAREVGNPLALVQSMDVDERMALPDTTVCFESRESTESVGTSVTNCVTHEEKDSWSVYWMRQRQGPGSAARTSWTLLAIATHRETRTSFFYKFPKAPFRGAKTPVALDPPCFACHANGPRKLRPSQDSEARIGLDVSARKLLAAFNNDIERLPAQRIVVPTDPVLRNAMFGVGADLSPHNDDACVMCHNGRRRAVLRGLHSDTAGFLRKIGAMPPHE